MTTTSTNLSTTSSEPTSTLEQERSLVVPELALVLLIGASGSGKSSFAKEHFLPTEVISSDHCRGLVSDDENDQTVSADAFDVVRYIASKRLAAGKLTVIDATNVQPQARRPLIELARQFHCLPVAIVLDVPAKTCHERNALRPDRAFGAHVVRNQTSQLRRGLRGLKREGFRYVYKLSSPEDIATVRIERQPLWNNKKHEAGPFDIIGDVHGCYAELVELLTKLGYAVDESSQGPIVTPPDGRRAVFVGDLVDRGPGSSEVLKLVMAMVDSGQAFCVAGNHEAKLKKWLDGRNVKTAHGLQETIDQLEGEPDSERQRMRNWLDRLVSHYVFDDGRLVVAHAGLKEELQGRGSGKVRAFAMYGETTGETDAFGFPVRYNWASDYRGRAKVVYGHTPVPRPEWLNRTICIDTGCVFGGQLTALRYPENDIVSVEAHRTYYEPVVPLAPEEDERPSDVLDREDVQGKRIISTALHHSVSVREENAAAALEVMSRFAVDPQWLMYLPPTMSPSETCREGPFLEHPQEAFHYFDSKGVEEVVCEEKHMGSRAIVVVTKNDAVAKERFGAQDGRGGVIYTRTGRAFFNARELEVAALEKVRCALDRQQLWEELQTDWVCFDAELMPWSAKAQDLLRSQYGAVGAAAEAALGGAYEALKQAVARGGVPTELLDRVAERKNMVAAYRTAYAHYCWETAGIEDFKLAPFQILASESGVHMEQDHVWHMETIAKLAAGDDLLVSTPYRVVTLADEASRQAATEWWNEHTAKGGEGMVVKPRSPIVRGKKGLVQPGVKCRGREYLRIIYGPEYSAPEHLERLRARRLGAKRSLALREFALGHEALHRFVRREPLYRVHECVFGVLALESEPVDPRL